MFRFHDEVTFPIDHYQSAADLENLNKGSAYWNELPYNSVCRPKLHSLFCEGHDLAGYSLERAYLQHSRFMNLSITDVIFTRAIMDFVIFSGVKFTNVTFDGAECGSAVFNNCEFINTSFSGANMSSIVMRDCHAQEQRLLNISIKNSEIDSCHFINCNFSAPLIINCAVRGCSFASSRIIGGEFEQTKFNDTDFTYAYFLQTDFSGASINRCMIYGCSVIDCRISGCAQSELYYIDPSFGLLSAFGGASDMQVLSPGLIEFDRIEFAPLLQMLLNNETTRFMIDAFSKKLILILGNFSQDTKPALDTLRKALSMEGFIPILFDFDKPDSRTLSETVSAIAHLCKCVIADLTSPRSVPQELMRIVPNLTSVKVIPIINCKQEPYGMFSDFLAYPSMGNLIKYECIKDTIKPILGIINE